MQKRERLYEGKAKKVYATDDARFYIIEYKDNILIKIFTFL